MATTLHYRLQRRANTLEIQWTWIKTWGQWLHDCISRLEFVRTQLDMAITEKQSVSYLNEVYPQFVRDH
ncbi:hypothetical protein EV132_11482 [Rhizobium sullae]|uniref:Uncharacterized protein n=1 Tax=Rhizobium sullae TaxID=50338 RepID=A0A4R3PWS0_RHISU|nr:hypothetical protein EV132_11482 [Rhizobium sullae]